MSDYFKEIKDLLTETHPEKDTTDISDVVTKVRNEHGLDAEVAPRTTQEAADDSPNYFKRRVLTGIGVAAASAALVFSPNILHAVHDSSVDSQQTIENLDQNELSHLDSVSGITILVDDANIRSTPGVKDIETPGYNILDQLPAGTVLETKDGVYKYSNEFDANGAWIGFHTDDENDKDGIAWVAEKNVELTSTN